MCRTREKAIYNRSTAPPLSPSKITLLFPPSKLPAPLYPLFLQLPGTVQLCPGVFPLGWQQFCQFSLKMGVEIPEPAIHPLLVWPQDVSKLSPFYFYPHCHLALRGRSILPPLLFSLQKWDIVSSFFDLKAKNSYRKLFSRCFTVWT